MSSPARSFGELLAKGKVVSGGCADRADWYREGAPHWELCRFFGRVVEVTGWGARGRHEKGRSKFAKATAKLTVATRLVRAAQERREPVAWITDVRMPFYPPDVASHGVDLDALAVIRVPGEGRGGVAAFRAADQLLRSGAFGLVVLDAPSVDERRIPLQVEIRLSNLARAHGAVLLWLRGQPRDSQASVRAIPLCERVAEGRFRCTIRVVKDKRVGQLWEQGETFDGPLGLR